MRHLAILTMLLSWLLYGAMPAVGDCPMAGSSAEMAGMGAAAMHDMAGMGGPMAMPAANAQSSDRHPALPDSHGNAAHVSFCAACVVVPPLGVFHDSKALAFAYPAPAAMQPLRDARAAPTPPPPRFA